MKKLPENAFENGELVKYVFIRTEPNPVPSDHDDQEWKEDAGIHFWTGDDPKNAPEGYRLLKVPTKRLQ